MLHPDIHSFIFFNESFNVKSGYRNGRREKCREREAFRFAFVLFFLLTAFSLTHTLLEPKLSCLLLPTSLTVAVFHSAFPSLNFHWRNFPFSLPSRGCILFDIPSRFRRTFHSNSNRVEASDGPSGTFEFESLRELHQIYLFVSSSRLSITFPSLFIQLSRWNFKTSFSTISKLSQYLTLAVYFRLSSRIEFPEEKKNIFIQ